MLLQKEITTLAERYGVPPDTIDKDWVLGHVLYELYKNNWAQENLVFKGGTCLKKCYFSDYRFSEDLDFTIKNAEFDITKKMFQSVCDNITNNIGILLGKVHVDTIVWEDRSVGYKILLPFWGANHRKNSQPPSPDRWQTVIKIELIKYEKLVCDLNHRQVLSFYSDYDCFNDISIPCYDVKEIIAEKFRALLQRSYPAPRDYYDLWILTRNLSDNEWPFILQAFKEKCLFKNIIFTSYSDFFDSNELIKVRKAWENSIGGHLSVSQLPDMDKVMSDLKAFCAAHNWK